MAGTPLKLTIDRQNRRLVAYQGTPPSLPDLFQSNTISLQIQVADPGPSSTPVQVTQQQYVVANMGAFGMRAAIGDTPEGVTGPTPIALQDTMVWDPVNLWFAGDIALNTTAVNDFIGTSAVKPAYFEVNLTLLTTRTTILQITFNLKAVVDELAGVVPTPTDVFLTAAETKAQFVPQKGAAGQTFILVSPDGTKSMELGVDNNGNFITREF